MYGRSNASIGGGGGPGPRRLRDALRALRGSVSVPWSAALLLRGGLAEGSGGYGGCQGREADFGSADGIEAALGNGIQYPVALPENGPIGRGVRGWGGGGGWHKASVFDCLPLAAPIGLSPLLILTLCGPERVLVVSTEPPDDVSCFDYSGGGWGLPR